MVPGLADASSRIEADHNSVSRLPFDLLPRCGRRRRRSVAPMLSDPLPDEVNRLAADPANAQQFVVAEFFKIFDVLDVHPGDRAHPVGRSVPTLFVKTKLSDWCHRLVRATSNAKNTLIARAKELLHRARKLTPSKFVYLFISIIVYFHTIMLLAREPAA